MARTVRITPDRLGPEIEKILAEYGDDVEDNLDVITKKVAQKGRSALRNEALRTRSFHSSRCGPDGNPSFRVAKKSGFRFQDSNGWILVLEYN